MGHGALVALVLGSFASAARDHRGHPTVEAAAPTMMVLAAWAITGVAISVVTFR